MTNACALLSLLLFLNTEAKVDYGPAIPRELCFVIDVECRSRSGNGGLEDVVVHLALPSKNDRQELGELQFRPAPKRIFADDHGNNIGEWVRPDLNPSDVFTIEWQTTITTRNSQHTVDRERLLPFDQAPKAIRETYLQGGSKYALTDPSLVAAAKSAGKGARDPLDLVFQLNEFLRAKLVYKNDGVWDDAPKVLAQGHGSCSEYNFLFMALCRIQKIPVRYVGATALRSNDPVYEDSVFHRWTEVYLPGHGWFPVDTSRNDGEEGEPANQAFGRISDRLLITMKGDGSDQGPLGWGYVASVTAKRRGDAEVAHKDRFVWESPKKPTPDDSGN